MTSDHLALLWLVLVWFVIGAVCSYGSHRTRAGARAVEERNRAEPKG
jgi:hypothetical protein